MVGARTVASVAYALLLIVVARYMTPDNFGDLSAIVGVGAFASVLFDVGLTSYILRSPLPPRQDPEVLSVLRMLWISSCGVVATTVCVRLLGLVPGVTWNVAVLVGVWMMLERISECQTSIVVSEGSEGTATILIILRRALPLPAFFLLNEVLLEPSDAFALAMISGCLLSVPLGGAVISRFVDRSPPPTRWRSLLRKAVPYLLSSSSTQARELEATVFAAAFGSATAGFANLALRAARPYQLVASAVGISLTPATARRSQDFARGAVWRLLLLAAGLTAIGAIAAPFVRPVLSALVGEEYDSAVPYIVLSLLMAGFVAIGSPLNGICQALGKQTYVATVGLAASLSAFSAIGVVAWMSGGALYALAAILAIYTMRTLALAGRALNSTRMPLY